MKTTSIRIDAPAKPKIRTVIAREDGLGVIFVDFELRNRWFPQQVSMFCEVWIWRVPYPLGFHGITIRDICLAFHRIRNAARAFHGGVSYGLTV
jgi:hypothetical protein